MHHCSSKYSNANHNKGPKNLTIQSIKFWQQFISLIIMSGLRKIDDQYTPLQIKVFTRWVQHHIRGSQIQITDLFADLKNGVILVRLAEALTKRQRPRKLAARPTRVFEQVENCDMAIEMFKADGIRFENISGQDVNKGETKLILGLIWTLILHYSVSASVQDDQVHEQGECHHDHQDDQAQLLDWARQRTAGYDNLDGLAPYDLLICALLDSYYPEQIEYATLDPENVKENTQKACQVMTQNGVTVYVYSEDAEHGVDHKTLITQLAAVKSVLDTPENNENAIQRRRIYEQTNQVTQRGGIQIETQNANANNNAYDSRKFALTMTLRGNEYNDGLLVDDDAPASSTSITLALSLVHPENSFLNPAGWKLDLVQPDPTDSKQHFTFGQGEWNTVIDSAYRQGMVWDVADEANLNPPEGTPFYLFPFHGRHNQRFVYLNNQIFATQNGQVITYVGGEHPFVTHQPTFELRNRQRFNIQLL